MQNPYQDAARQINAEAKAVEEERNRAKAAAEEARIRAENEFMRAQSLFSMVSEKAQQEVELINDALESSDIRVTCSFEQIKHQQIGTIKITLNHSGAEKASFRLVGNSNFKLFIRDLPGNRFGPFELDDAKHIPYQGIFQLFLQEGQKSIRGGQGGLG